MKKIEGNSKTTKQKTFALGIWFRKVSLLFVLVLFPISYTNALCNDVPFGNNETIEFEIKYKYGIAVLKAGNIQLNVKSDNYGNIPAYRSEVNLKTSSFFDNLYKMRDTLISYASVPNITPLFHFRSVNEGSSHFREEQVVLNHSKKGSSIRVIRTKGETTLIDSVIYSRDEGFDIPNLLLYIRSLDYSNLKVGDTMYVTTFLGKKQTSVVCIYRGEAIVQKSKKKYKTLKFDFDVVNDVFTESKKALELWIGDDENRLPIKLKAKLKIGAAEAVITSFKNLKYPFDAEVSTKK
ncbi:DUF3108 domain-containing protein [Bacteroidales bacterium OttesenSCG-928-M11]|nr:DUF3108 domain-containing protein [Bacteroidales bacterium OttesenSCG-928-M11]